MFIFLRLGIISIKNQILFAKVSIKGDYARYIKKYKCMCTVLLEINRNTKQHIDNQWLKI